MVDFDRWSLNTSGHKDRFDCTELHAAWNKIDNRSHECR